MSWRARIAGLLVILFGTGMGLIIGWRYADVSGLWADLGMALSVLSAISLTLIAVAKAEEVSE